MPINHAYRSVHDTFMLYTCTHKNIYKDCPSIDIARLRASHIGRSICQMIFTLIIVAYQDQYGNRVIVRSV